VLFEPIRDKIEELAFGGDVIFPPAIAILDPDTLKSYEGTFLLPTGGKFEVRSKGGVLRMNPDGQDAVNAIFNIKKPDAEAFDQLNDLSEKLFNSALSRDLEEIEKVLYDRDRMMGFFREIIPMILARHKKRMGVIKVVSSLSAHPFDLEEEKASQVFVELKGEKGSLYFDLVWRDSKVVGLGITYRTPDIPIPFLPMQSGGNEFVGYRLDMARNFRINFLVEEDGKISGLVVPNEDGPIEALKSK